SECDQREAREDHAPLGVEAKALGCGQPLVISGLTTDEGRLLRDEAVEEAVAAGALQIVLTAAPVRPARGMRRVPGLRRVVVAQPLPVVMTDHRRAGA